MFYEGTNIFVVKLVLFLESWIIIGRVESKNNFQTILVMIFCLFLIILRRSESSKVKWYFVLRIASLVHKLPRELPNDLRLRILGNFKIVEKSQIWVETQLSCQSSFHKLNVGNGCQKQRKIRYYIFEVFSKVTVFV